MELIAKRGKMQQNFKWLPLRSFLYEITESLRPIFSLLTASDKHSNAF